MIPRPRLLERIRKGFSIAPIVTLLGPRQCGKTTLARSLMRQDGGTLYDLEDPADEAALRNPLLVLKNREGLIVIDEVQRLPELFPVLRVLVDQTLPSTQFLTRYLLLGSASPRLVRSVSETLAGRTTFVEMAGFTLEEVGLDRVEPLWLRGGFPRSYLSPSEEESFEWRQSFIRAFLERDIPQLGFSLPATTLRRFWTMVAHYHGQVWNGSVIARSLGVNEKTVRRYLDILEGAFLVRVLPPWHGNLGKRLVKSPKVYLRDSGLLHTLLGIQTVDDLLSHPVAGFSWEGFCVETLLERFRGWEGYFYATHGGAELDLLLQRGTKRYGFEMKLTQAPSLTRSMGIVREDLKLDRLFVVYPGTKEYPLAERIVALPLPEALALPA